MIAAVLAMGLLFQDSTHTSRRDSIRVNEIVKVVDAVADYYISTPTTRPPTKDGSIAVPLIVEMKNLREAFGSVTERTDRSVGSQAPLAAQLPLEGQPKRLLRDSKIQDETECRRVGRACAVAGVTQVLWIESVSRTKIAGVFEVVAHVGYIEPTGVGPGGFMKIEFFVRRQPTGWQVIRTGRRWVID